MHVQYHTLIHEARKYTLDNRDEVAEWCSAVKADPHSGRDMLNLHVPQRHITGEEGFSVVRPGDYIVKVADNLFWVCSGEQFEALFRVLRPEELVPDVYDSTFARRMRRTRTAQNMTQAALAAKTGLPVSSISHYESGRRSPNYASLLTLSKALNVSADYLLGKT